MEIEIKEAARMLNLVNSLSVVDAINTIRTANGLSSLSSDDSLNQLASSWANVMATSNGLDHGDFADRIASVYPNTYAAENIAEGQPDATSVVACWMNSPPHRANLLGAYNRLGVGADQDQAGLIYWCVDFVQID